MCEISVIEIHHHASVYGNVKNAFYRRFTKNIFRSFQNFGVRNKLNFNEIIFLPMKIIIMIWVSRHVHQNKLYLAYILQLNSWKNNNFMITPWHNSTKHGTINCKILHACDSNTHELYGIHYHQVIQRHMICLICTCVNRTKDFLSLPCLVNFYFICKRIPQLFKVYFDARMCLLNSSFQKLNFICLFLINAPGVLLSL